MTRTEKLVTALVLAVNLGVGAHLIANSDYSQLVSPGAPASLASISALSLDDVPMPVTPNFDPWIPVPGER